MSYVLHKIGTWYLVPLPSNKHAIDCQWVYKIKTKVDEFLEQYKAHLVAKSFAQEYGVDCETFAPIARMTSMSILIYVASSLQWPLFHIIKNAFLNGDLSEKVYMCPLGLEHSPGHACCLRHALYGLVSLKIQYTYAAFGIFCFFK